MAWPSTITSFTNPTPAQKLSSPSHSSIETAQNTGLTEIQTFLGTMGASALGTLIGTVYNPSSDGGGHIQGVTKGGTGLTSYTKGDLIVGSSTSLLSKLAVGTDAQVLTADSSVAGGIKWAANPTAFSNKIAVSAVQSTAGAGVTTEQSIFSTTLNASTLGTSNAVRTTVYVNNFAAGAAQTSIFLNANYGGKTVASLTLQLLNSNNNQSGTVSFTILANGSQSSQRNILNLNLPVNRLSGNNQSVGGFMGYASSVNSVDSGANQTLGMTVRYNVSDIGNTFTYDGYTIEKIA